MTKSIIKQLEEQFGGKWEYIRDNFPNGTWHCKEKDVYAYYVATGGYDVNGEYMKPSILQMRVYGMGTPEEFIPEQSYNKYFNKINK